jgi:hypothetical protein
VTQQVNSALGRLTVKVFDYTKLGTDTHTHARAGTHTVRLLWTNEQNVAEGATHTTHNKHKRRMYKSAAGFEPAIPAKEQAQTYALDRTATGISITMLILNNII